MTTLPQAFELAVRHHQAGQLAQAEGIYRQILARQPAHADAMHLLGVIAHQVGRHDAALDLIRRAIALRPNFPDAHNSLGIVLKAHGNLDEAITAYRGAIALKANHPEACSNLGNALAEKGQLDEAIVAYRQAIGFKPDYADAYRNLGNALSARGQLDEAIAAYGQAVALKPGSAEAYLNLGNVFKEKGTVDDAIDAYRRAIALKPDYAEVHSNFGIAVERKGRLDQAIAAYRLAIALKPEYAEAHNNLAGALKDKGELDEAIAEYRQAIELRPEYPDAHSNLVYTMHLHPGYEAGTIVEEHRRWNRQHAEGLRKFMGPHANDRDPGRRLRIGYVSPDLREHPVGRFLLPLLSHHDHEAFEVFAYAQVSVADGLTQRLKSATDRWRSIVGLSDHQAAELIRQDQIDILVDLSGHTAQNRLLVFARKPAPVQVTYLGYPDSTGMGTIDYRLTDAHADPLGKTEAYHCEQLIRLSLCAWCFSPPPSPPITPRLDAPITLGSFNNFAKVTEPMLRLWGRIMRAVPGSRLLLKASGLGSDGACRRVRELLSGCGISPDRLDLRGYEPGDLNHLALYGRMDIALDTFPYNGTTTTCEALWMGVPVVNLAGANHVSRVGVSLLSNAGLPELVANDPDEYERIALGLANDLPRLSDLRSTLRQRMERSPLMDGPALARNIEAAYRRMWRTWCEADAR